MDASNGNAVEDMSKSGAPQRAPLDAESSRQAGSQTGRLITGLIFAVVVMLFVKAAASAGAGL